MINYFFLIIQSVQAAGDVTALLPAGLTYSARYGELFAM